MVEYQRCPFPPLSPGRIRWFRSGLSSKFGTPTEPQEQGWPHILAGRTTLISAPTGSGKTLAAFLACIDRLVRKALAGRAARSHRSAVRLAAEGAGQRHPEKSGRRRWARFLQLAGERGLLMPEIRTAVRTGDTLMHERRAMLKRPPHILVTTPESLYILLTAEKSRAMLRDVETVIVDEIHAVADDKRGAHLALSLERLEALTASSAGAHRTFGDAEADRRGRAFSDRQRPARSGHRQCRPSSASWISRSKCRQPNLARSRQRDVGRDLRPARGAGRAASLDPGVRQHAAAGGARCASSGRAPGRGQCCGASRQPFAQAAAGSGAKLKEGEVKVLVATASLELGIDIGTVDLVVPDRFSAGDRGGAAAHRPRGALARRDSEGTILRHHAR